MAHVQYNTTVLWDPTLKCVGFDDEGLAIDAEKITPGAPDVITQRWRAGAIVQNIADGSAWLNIGTTTSPNWISLGAGGGGSIIIDTTPVTGGGANEVLYTDPTGSVVTSDFRFTRDLNTGEFNVSGDVVAPGDTSSVFIGTYAGALATVVGSILSHVDATDGQAAVFAGNIAALGVPVVSGMTAQSASGLLITSALVSPTGVIQLRSQDLGTGKDGSMLVSSVNIFNRIDTFYVSDEGGSNDFFVVDTVNRRIAFGDIGLIGNGGIASLDDALQIFAVHNDLDPVIYAELATFDISFGDVNGTGGNDTRLSVRDSTQTMTYEGLQFTLADAHLGSFQNSPPSSDLTGTTLNDGGGTGASIVFGADSTDTAGFIVITAGNGTPGAGLAGRVVFNVPFIATAPRVVIAPRGSDSAALKRVWVSGESLAGFDIYFETAAGTSEVNDFVYHVIG